MCLGMVHWLKRWFWHLRKYIESWHQHRCKVYSYKHIFALLSPIFTYLGRYIRQKGLVNPLIDLQLELCFLKSLQELKNQEFCIKEVHIKLGQWNLQGSFGIKMECKDWKQAVLTSKGYHLSKVYFHIHQQSLQ